ncbi:putative oligopeptide ABC transporter ATP binding subunit [Rhodovastum atsumiense]|uniref:ABC transporter ATP-binding protein n=1 Tax=Rhodovastum atsumiense TaxID=504468 RepID=A0A5M6IYF9_9PROT|nr:ABC transporter ATP-binding protein [Rhodovastum atsumiense]KAA5612405.1 ABC transporter ATP-binding protein [Rhodovastum atsumiense]CAH2600311.1 putative oligopeptide ABC transporter ATP binding subunit [Rhodovastum atsumiense]
MSLVRVEDLTVAFGERRVVDRVSFTLERGETLALVGESGSGKSLTALSLLQLLPPGASCGGHVELDGQSMIGAPEAVLQQLRGARAGMVFQEPMNSLNPLARIGRQVGEAIQLHRPMSNGALRARVIELLSECGFPDAGQRLEAFPHQLSGGQRQRVMIAMALANDPALLIADEPTTALDVTIQAQILKLLAAEKAARGLALLLISHDLAVVRRYADRVCVMKDGRVVESGRVDQVFTVPQHPYTCALLAAEPRGTPRPIANDAEVLMQAKGLRVHFPIRRGVLRRTVGHVKAVDGLDITVHAGETVGLVGESGSGKSTTGFALLQLERAEGDIRFRGQKLDTLDRRALRRLRASMQIVFQDPFGSLSPRLSVGEIIAEGLAVHEPGLSRAKRDARVAAALDEVGLPGECLGRYPHEFSGGQRQRIAVARAMVLQPRFVVLDEPTSALDMSVQAQIVDLLRRLQQDRDLGYLFISHDLRVVRALAHRVVVLRHGKVVEEGPADVVFAQPREDYTRALMAAAFSLEADETGVVQS